jgi:hypothetical protein
VDQFIQELVTTVRQTYSVCIEESEQDAPEIVVMSISDGRTICFHIAITCTNADIENAKEVCSQAILYRSTENDPHLFFAVYDCLTQKLYFCLLDPLQQAYENITHYTTQDQAGEAVTRLQTYIASNAEALQ